MKFEFKISPSHKATVLSDEAEQFYKNPKFEKTEDERSRESETSLWINNKFQPQVFKITTFKNLDLILITPTLFSVLKENLGLKMKVYFLLRRRAIGKELFQLCHS